MEAKRRVSLVSVLVVFCSVLAAEGLFATEPPQAPILRIETGAHTAVIRSIGVDAAGRYLVSASEDKTLRLWDAGNGRLLKTYRIPIGPGNEGKLNAAAISPDGGIIAGGGWTGWDWDGSACIYLLDRETGRLLRRITGLPDVINHLAFSRDGRHLAAALARGGLRVFRVADGGEVARDGDYGAASYGADFDAGGRLATSCLDGYIRLYAPDFRLLVKKRAPGGDHPFTVRFSPDGRRLAVGFGDSTAVSVLSGSDLAPLYAPDTTGVDNGNLGSVSWSADGRLLYAGGRYQKAGQLTIRRWAEAGRGAGQDIRAGAANTITDIRPRREGGVFFGAGDPALGAIDAAGRSVFLVTPAIADYRGMLKEFLVSADGATIRFGYEFEGKAPARFDIASRLLEAAPGTSAALRPPRTEARALAITDWEDNVAPKLNGRPLPLRQHEMSRSLAITPDGNRFLLGTSWLLRLFDRSARELWQTPAPVEAGGVNISGDGRYAVAAFGDGTIRWYDMTDGRELLAFFPHSDRKRWVLWSQGGYYDASAGAEDLIGWHINSGKDNAADFFSASRFRGTYYRPDVVARVLAEGGEDRALRLADEEAGRRKQLVETAKILPPVVTILSPKDLETVTQTEVEVAYLLRSPSGEPVTAVRALIDGRPAGQERGVKVVAKDALRGVLRITIPERDCEIGVIAENRFAVSEPSTVRIRYRGMVKKEEEFVVKPRLYVLAGSASTRTKALLCDWRPRMPGILRRRWSGRRAGSTGRWRSGF